MIRHGESRANAGSRTTGSATNPLTPLGERQAAHVAQILDHTPDLVVHSPYLRARRTAEPTIARFPTAEVAEWRIEEFTYLGRFHGTPTTAAQRSETVDDYWETADPDYRDDPASESFVDVHARARRFLTDLVESDRRHVVAFTHGMFMRVVVWAIMTGDAVPDSENMRWFYRFRLPSTVPNCSILPLTYSEKTGFRFLSATTAHLPARLRSGGY